MNTSTYHIFLSSPNVDRTIKFYLDSFEGAKVSYPFKIDGHEMYMISLGNGLELEIMKVAGPLEQEQCPRWGHIAFECKDLQSQFDRMVAAGARVKQPIKWDVVLNGEPKAYCAGAFLYGPDDEIIELCYSDDKLPWRD